MSVRVGMGTCVKQAGNRYKIGAMRLSRLERQQHRQGEGMYSLIRRSHLSSKGATQERIDTSDE